MPPPGETYHPPSAVPKSAITAPAMCESEESGASPGGGTSETIRIRPPSGSRCAAKPARSAASYSARSGT